MCDQDKQLIWDAGVSHWRWWDFRTHFIWWVIQQPVYQCVSKHSSTEIPNQVILKQHLHNIAHNRRQWLIQDIKIVVYVKKTMKVHYSSGYNGFSIFHLHSHLIMANYDNPVQQTLHLFPYSVGFVVSCVNRHRQQIALGEPPCVFEAMFQPAALFYPCGYIRLYFSFIY